MAETAKARYDQLVFKRQPFLERAWDYAELSIPSILPRNGVNGTNRLPEPYQAFISRLVLNLSAKLLLALLPPGSPVFRLQVSPEVLIKEGKLDLDAETEKKLEMVVNLMTSEIERRAWRMPTNVVLQHLIVTGNALEQTLPDNTIRAFRLDQYVVLRDYAGNLLELVVEEKVAAAALPKAAQGLVSDDARKNMQNNVCLYTHAVRQDDGSFTVYQEVEGQRVPGSEGSYQTLPYRAMRWSVLAGEDYGRGKIEEHIGDVRSMEAFRKSMIDGAAMAARHVTLVKPNATGTNLKNRIAKANNGDVIIGNPDDIHMLSFENVQGLQLVQAEVQVLRESLAAAFLLSAGVVRNSERTTAEEIRMVAQELEGALGGVYSLLAEEMMRPRVERLQMQMTGLGKLPPLPKGVVDPQILVGLEALGRERDVSKVQAAGGLAQVLDPNNEYVKTDVLLNKAFTGLGLPSAVRTQQEVDDRRQQMAQMQAATQAAGQAVGQMAGQATNPTPGG